MRSIPAETSFREAVDEVEHDYDELMGWVPGKALDAAARFVYKESFRSLVAYVEVLRVRSICPTCGMTVAECERMKTVCR